MSQMSRLEELGYYLLGGQPASPAPLPEEARRGEELGLGTGFISERWNIKESSSLSGAALAVTSELNVAIGATNHTLRHPVVTASWATTMHKMSGGRFQLGLGRGVAKLHQAFGLPPITTAQMEDFAQLMRRLWRGETIVDHDGPAGRFGMLQLDSAFDEQIPLGIMAFGENTLKLGGRAFDFVVLHTFFTEETLERCVRTVKEAAEQAGRDPGDVAVWSCFATIGDSISGELQTEKLVARLSTYLQYYGDLMVSTNRWDPQVLERFRADPLVQTFTEAIDGKADADQLEHMATLIPDEWLAPAAVGTPEHCVKKIQRERELGADKVILHGATPDELAPILDEYRRTAAAS